MYNDYLILSKNGGKKYNSYEKVAVIIYMYYDNKLDYYYNYLKKISNDIDMYIITSNKNNIVKLYSRLLALGKNVKIRTKKNRGRDISAFLIAAKDILDRYKYVCFLHDKNCKTQDMREDTEIWENNIWENTLCNEQYIDEILCYFEANPQIGLMLPPAPYSKNIPRWYTNSWLKNYDNTVKLLKQLGCNIEINYEMFPLSIGTNFWVRTKAIEKLYKYNWRYEDFDEEPLRIDGTISHAIERSLSFIVRDSGYMTKIIMNNEWAQDFFSILQRDLVKIFENVGGYYGIRSLQELSTFAEREDEIKEFVSQDGEAYIYGAGDRAEDCEKCLNRLNIRIKGYLVTDNVNANPKQNIYNIDSIINKNEKIIVAVGINYREQIVDTLKKNNFCYYYLF